MEKKCTMCGITKEISNFFKNKTRKDGYANSCKECMKDYNSNWYDNNKNTFSDYRKNNRIKIRKFIYNYFKSHHCVDCGESDPIVLEFDHLRDKKFNISDSISRGFSIKKIEKEINKCDVVCSNCHKKRTAKTYNWYNGLT